MSVFEVFESAGWGGNHAVLTRAVPSPGELLLFEEPLAVLKPDFSFDGAFPSSGDEVGSLGACACFQSPLWWGVLQSFCRFSGSLGVFLQVLFWHHFDGVCCGVPADSLDPEMHAIRACVALRAEVGTARGGVRWRIAYRFRPSSC